MIVRHLSNIGVSMATSALTVFVLLWGAGRGLPPAGPGGQAPVAESADGDGQGGGSFSAMALGHTVVDHGKPGGQQVTGGISEGDLTLKGNRAGTGDVIVTSDQSTTDLVIDNTASDGDPTLSLALTGTTAATLFVDDGDNDSIKFTDVNSATWLDYDPATTTTVLPAGGLTIDSGNALLSSGNLTVNGDTSMSGGEFLLLDNGAGSPLFGILADDGGPWPFIISNETWQSNVSLGLKFFVGNTGNSGFYAPSDGVSDHGSFTAYTAGAARFSIAADGKIGMGPNAGTTVLVDIEDADATETALQISNTLTGDPVVTWALSGSRKFTMGIDDSDSDQLKIGVGADVHTSTVMTFDGQEVGIGGAPVSGQTLNVAGNMQITGGDLSFSGGQLSILVDGAASPLFLIRGDDSNPWHFILANETYGTDTQGMKMLALDGGDVDFYLPDDGSSPGSLNIRTDGTTRFTVDTAGTLWPDNSKAQFGTGADATTYFDATDWISKNTASDSDNVWYVSDGGVDTEILRMDGATHRIGLGGETAPELPLHITGYSPSGIYFEQSGNVSHQMVGDSNRTGANAALWFLEGRWNGDNVCNIQLATGGDTVNKDDGRIFMATQASAAGGVVTHFKLDENGLFGLGHTGTIGAKVHLRQQSTTGAIPVVELDQDDTDKPFIEFDGTEGASTTTSISTDTTEGTVIKKVHVTINGTRGWILIHDDP